MLAPQPPFAQAIPVQTSAREMGHLFDTSCHLGAGRREGVPLIFMTNGALKLKPGVEGCFKIYELVNP